MLRHRLVIALASCLFGGAALAQAPSVSPPSNPADQEIHRAKLDVQISEMAFEDITFEQAIDGLAEKTRANIVIDRRALEASGFDVSQKVRLKFYDLTLSAALRVILAKYPHVVGRISFTASDGVILITTVDALSAGPQPTFAYDIRDFTERPFGPPATSPAPPANDGTSQNGTAVFLGMTPSTWSARQERIDRLIKLLTETVAQESWRNSGGLGRIEEWDGLLIVTQTPENHRKLQTVLHNLRKLRNSAERGEKPATQPVDLLKTP